MQPAGTATAELGKSARRLALAVLLLLPLMALASYQPRPQTPASAAPITLPAPSVAENVWQERGRVVHQEVYDPPLEDAAVLGRAWRANYVSTSGVDGSLREISGAFFVPHGTPPGDGWPVISLAHGTTGIGNNCGPSRHPRLTGYSTIVEPLLANGYAVALSDYEGLGEGGSHPYLEPRSAAFNTVDAVRALRNISPAVSSRWIALGYSQGGQAVWSASELNSYYGDGLQLMGSVALAPAANVTGVADLAWSGSMSTDQRAVFPLLIVGLSRYDPGIDDQSFLNGPAFESMKQFTRCEHREAPPSSDDADTTHNDVAPVPWLSVVNRLSESRALKPASADDLAELRVALRRIALPQHPLETPMLVVTGERDVLVPQGWVQSAVSDSCALGGRIEYQAVPDSDHNDIVWMSGPIVSGWIADRFAGLPAPSNCPPGEADPSGR